MKKFIIALLLLPSLSFASPFLVCDPLAGISYYAVTNLDGLSNPNVAAQADGSIKMDLAGLTAGTYTVAVQACDNLWGCSAPANFTFTKPATISLPASIKLTK